MNFIKKFFYVVIDDLSVANLAKDKKALIQLLNENTNENPAIKTFDSLQEAQDFVNQYNKNPGVKPKSDVQPGIKLFKRQENGDPNITYTDELRAKYPNLKEGEGPSLSSGDNIHFYFKENEDQFNIAKGKISEQEQYSLIFNGGANSKGGRSNYVIYNSSHQEIYSNIINLNKANAPEAQYCALIYGLKSAQNLGIKKLLAFTNLEFIMGHFKDWKVNHNMKTFYDEARALTAGFSGGVKFEKFKKETI